MTFSRSKARKRALNVLFEAEQRDINANSMLAERLRLPGQESALPQYAIDITEGVIAHLDRIDEILETYSSGWSIERMPSVDRTLLRIGVWEILYNDEVPDVVAIDEAVALSKGMSTDESPGFINGLLARIVEVKETLVD